MGYVVSVLCRSPEPITPDQIIQIFRDEIDFIDDHSPIFDPASSSATLWDRLDVHYDGDGLIQFQLADAALIEGVVEETIDQHEISGALAERLRETRSMISIRPHPSSSDVEIAKGVWELLAVVQYNLALYREGLIVDHRGVRDVEQQILAGT